MKKEFKSKKKKLIFLSILAVIVITIGASFAFYYYSDLGDKENSIAAGTIKFLYDEGQGDGISLTNAMPMTDDEGKAQNDYFDFSVTGTSGPTKLSYEITLRKTNDSDNIDDSVKVYLSKVGNNVETQKVLSIYNNLRNSNNQLAQNHTEKTLYKGSIQPENTDYTENFRLRIWLNNNTRDGAVYESPQTITATCSDPTYTTKEDCIAAKEDWVKTATANEKTFKVKVNVYAEAATLSPDTSEKLAAGLYDDNNEIIYTWEELIDNNYLNVDENGALSTNETITQLSGSIVIDDSVTSIANMAFTYWENLKAVTIPNTVTSIGEQVFAEVPNLASITVDSNNPVYDSRNNSNAIIETATNKLIVGCQNTIIPNNVTSIGDSAFAYVTISSITIPNSVTSIGDNAFAFSTISSITIPASVTSIGDYAFIDCKNLASVTFDSNSQLTSIGNQAFGYCDALTNITIPASVTSIGNYAFIDCKNLASVIFESNSQLTSIGTQSFENCDSLTSIIIPASVTSIGNQAFLNCSKLTTITFANTNGWKAGSITISSTNLSNTSTAATYLKDTYSGFHWRRSN